MATSGVIPTITVGATQSRHLHQVGQGARRERVEHVEGRDVDDDPAGALSTNLVDHVLLQPRQLTAIERSVDRDHEIRALGEYRDPKWLRRLPGFSAGHRHAW